jgi:hypothetical protein
MVAYQLRLRKDQRLQDLVEAMVKEIWDFSLRYLDERKIHPGDFRDFEEATRFALEPFTGAYDRCGSYPECTDKVKGAQRLDYDDRIYFLTLPCAFPDFIEQLSIDSLQSIQHLTKPKFGALIYETIQDVFCRNLAQHLYYNPVCGRIAVCNDSHPIHP